MIQLSVRDSTFTEGSTRLPITETRPELCTHFRVINSKTAEYTQTNTQLSWTKTTTTFKITFITVNLAFNMQPTAVKRYLADNPIRLLNQDQTTILTVWSKYVWIFGVLLNARKIKNDVFDQPPLNLRHELRVNMTDKNTKIYLERDVTDHFKQWKLFCQLPGWLQQETQHRCCYGLFDNKSWKSCPQVSPPQVYLLTTVLVDWWQKYRKWIRSNIWIEIEQLENAQSPFI